MLYLLPATAPSVNALDPVVEKQMPVIQKIIDDETWLDGDRRGCYVRKSDPVVINNVCSVIMRVGRELRQTFSGASSEREPCR